MNHLQWTSIFRGTSPLEHQGRHASHCCLMTFAFRNLFHCWCLCFSLIEFGVKREGIQNKIFLFIKHFVNTCSDLFFSTFKRKLPLVYKTLLDMHSCLYLILFYFYWNCLNWFRLPFASVSLLLNNVECWDKSFLLKNALRPWLSF